MGGREVAVERAGGSQAGRGRKEKTRQVCAFGARDPGNRSLVTGSSCPCSARSTLKATQRLTDLKYAAKCLRVAFLPVVAQAHSFDYFAGASCISWVSLITHFSGADIFDKAFVGHGIPRGSL